jgi:hypothetical protein
LLNAKFQTRAHAHYILVHKNLENMRSRECITTSTKQKTSISKS